MKEPTYVSDRSELADNIEADQVSDRGKSIHEMKEVNPVHDKLVLEGGETFLEYLRELDLADEPNLLVLSSRHHFFYDQNDLKGVKVLINLKKLNQIKHLDSYIHILFRVLPAEANFVGCFTDNRNHQRNGSALFKTGMFYKKVIDFLDHRTERRMTRSEVTELLGSHGFKVVDIREINGMTYFNTRNQRNSGE